MRATASGHKPSSPSWMARSTQQFQMEWRTTITNMTMVKRTTRNRSRYVWMAAIFSLSLLTCFGSPSNTGLLAAMYARQSTPPLTRQEIAKQLAELAATRAVFTLTPATAQQRLSKLAKLEVVKEPDTPDLQRLLGANPDSGIQWIQVVFERDKSWKFSEAEFAFALGDRGPD